MNRPALQGGGDRLLVLVGPSGAGKDAVLSRWLAGMPETVRPHRARRTITRAADPHEAHEPIGTDAFRAQRDRGAFALVWQAHDLHYGVRWRELEPLRRNAWVVLNGSRAHLPTLRDLAPALRVVEITAPSTLRAARLGQRDREHETARLGRLRRDIDPGAVDCRIVNDGALMDAVAQLHRWWQALAVDEAG